jgi:hypothetical protein
MPVQVRSSPQPERVSSYELALSYIINKNITGRALPMSDEKVSPNGGKKFWYLPPFPILATTTLPEEITWKKINPYTALTRCGGYPFFDDKYNGSILDNWPHFNGKPLPFFAQVVISPTSFAMVFLDDTVDGSWQAENAANAVLISDSKAFPHWVDIKPLERGTSDSVSMKFSDDSRCPAWTPSAVPSSPDWLQGDEHPEDSRLVLEIPSGLDETDAVNIGNRNGTAYVFVSNDNKRGWIIWQS